MFHTFDSPPRGLVASGNILLASVAHFADWSHTHAAKNLLFIAAIVGPVTTLAGLSAIFYHGTAWIDPEFDAGAWIGLQGYIFLLQLFCKLDCIYLGKMQVSIS
ncbi:hypothetical protein V8C42DRAFT_355981 [Trichoderma barbatum]